MLGTRAWLLASLLLAAGCQEQGLEGFHGRTMGTGYSVKYVSPETRQLVVDDVRAAVEAELAAFDRVFSTYRDDSEVSSFNRHEGAEAFPVDASLRELVLLAASISERTDGAFDLTVKPLRDLYDGWGDGAPLDEGELERTRARVGWRKLTVEGDGLRKSAPGLQIDVNAIAKGAGVDRVGAVLSRLGIESYFVEIGGEVVARGRKPGGKPWVVGIKDPRRPEAVLQAQPLTDRGMATSGSYFNRVKVSGQSWHHIFDPRTGRNAPNSVVSVTVLADSCMLADAWATALMVLGPEAGRLALQDQPAVAVLLITVDEAGALQEHRIRWPDE